MKDLVKNVTYAKFSSVVDDTVGQEPGWQQVAMVFRLTRSAIQMVGLGTGTALQIKEMTLKYMEDKFASWIVGQGGWVSCLFNYS